MITTSFEDDFFYILKKVRNNDSFSFSKFADGEFSILMGRSITNIDGWKYSSEDNDIERRRLVESFLYSDDDYIVGICCPCCAQEASGWMKLNRESLKGKLTWANIFVNSNYQHFCQFMVPEINDWPGPVHIIATEKGQGKTLPIKYSSYHPIPREAWKDPFAASAIDRLGEIAMTRTGQLFLFCAGPLGNILAHKLHLLNQSNTYLDIGSTLNPWLTGSNRDYLTGGSDSRKICLW
jgi:hypothetical protein